MKPRNNIAKLSFDTRMRIAQLLDDGASYDEVRSDDLIIDECANLSIFLHNNSFLAYRKSAEFKSFCINRRKWKDNLDRERISAEILKGSAGIESIANVAQMEALRALKDLLSTGALDPQDLTKVINALKAVNNVSKDRKIIELEARLQTTKTQVTNLKEQLNQGGDVDPSKVQDALDEILGLKK